MKWYGRSGGRIWGETPSPLGWNAGGKMAACGAAAEVPKNEVKPVTEVATPSAAVMSGLLKICPPVEETFPGVIAVPFA